MMNTTTKQRELSFDTYADVIVEIELLETVDYEKLANWNLGQICHHLSYYQKGALDGFGFDLPWLVKYFIGKPMKRKTFKTGRMKAGGQTLKQSVANDSIDDAAAIHECKEQLRLLESAETLQPSPLYGEMTIEEWKRLLLIHAAHHLGFLVPNR